MLVELNVVEQRYQVVLEELLSPPRPWSQASSTGHRDGLIVDVLGGGPVEDSAGHRVDPVLDASQVGGLERDRSPHQCCGGRLRALAERDSSP